MPHAELPPFGDDLRALLVEHLGRFERRALPIGDARHAAVAVVVVDSDAERHGDDPHPSFGDVFRALPGTDDLDLDGSVAGTAGGPAILLTRRSAGLRSHASQWAESVW